VEIINWLDDHSRYLLTSHAYPRVTGQIVITTFINIIEPYGLPQSTLTDMARSTPPASPAAAAASSTAREPGHRPEARGHPNHPRSQGRFVRTWLGAAPGRSDPGKGYDHRVLRSIVGRLWCSVAARTGQTDPT
jgi:hypothetical protein